MSKCIGLDVGGTFTDIVLLDGGIIESTGKVRTQAHDILGCVLNALDSLEVKDVSAVERITVSTTLVTNAIVEEKLPHVEVILFPGSGLLPDSFDWPFSYHVLSGEMDFRGHVMCEPDPREWRSLADQLKKMDLDEPMLFCIVGKFSYLNKSFEEELAAFLRREFPRARFSLGHRWGQINFFRRTQTCYLNLATCLIYEDFVQGLLEAVRARGYKAPVSVLKANCGVLPVNKACSVQTIYSGPAASVLGALAQTEHQDSFFVVDIGGTTTDIGIVLAGDPLLSQRGAKIGSYTTNVRSLAVRSVPVGGDSKVRFSQGKIRLTESGRESSRRRRIKEPHDLERNRACCLGGSTLTPTDAMRYLNLSDYGSRERAGEALRKALPADRRSAQEITRLAESIIAEMAAQINEAMLELQHDWDEEPAYRVWEVLRPESAQPLFLHLSGGSAPALAETFAQGMNLPVELAKRAQSTNALGSALARPSFTSTLHLDTNAGLYRIVETGEQGLWQEKRQRPYEEAAAFLRSVMEKRARAIGLTIDTLVEEDFSFFPQVFDNRTVGHIIRGSMHMPIGVMGRIAE